MSFFQALPIDVLHRYMYKFLVAKDIATLDTALTSSLYRDSYLKSLKGVTYAYVGYHKLSNACLDFFVKRQISCPRLELGPKIDYETISLIKQLYVQRIMLYGQFDASPYDDRAIKYHSVTSTREINFKKCERITSDAFEKLIHNCPNLTTLRMGDSSNICDRVMKLIGKLCPNINELSINGCVIDDVEGARDRHIIAIANSCKLLTSVDFSNCRLITGSSILALARHCHQLQYLKLDGCYGITDNSLSQLAQNCNDLQFISIHSCRKIHDYTLLNLSKYCKKLLTINIAYNDSTEDSLIALVSSCNHLLNLVVDGCPSVSDQFLTTVSEHCHELQSLSMNSCHNITNRGMLALASSTCCRYLTLLHLDVEDNENLTESAMIATFSNCPLLIDVKVNHSTCTDASIIVLSNHCPNLYSLSIYMDNLSIKAFLCLTHNCPKLQTLTLSLAYEESVQMSQICSSLITLGQNCKSIRHLICVDNIPRQVAEDGWMIAGFKTVTSLQVYIHDWVDEDIKCLVSGFPELRSLILLVMCCDLSDMTVKYISELCPKLVKLKMHGCGRMTNSCLTYLISGCPALKDLYMSGTWESRDLITHEAVSTFPKSCRLRIRQRFGCKQTPLTLTN